MATNAKQVVSTASCKAVLFVNDVKYDRVQLNVLSDLCSPIILGHDFLDQHSSVTFKFNGPMAELTVALLAPMLIDPPRIFTNMRDDVKPVATKQRNFSHTDTIFIRDEVNRLLSEGIIEPSNSPWRAQVLVAKNHDKQRMVIDYSQTVNRYCYIDAYPLPNMDELARKISHFKYYSKLDLKSAYHQILLHEDDKALTAFQADGRLYQFNRLPFGVTNAVSAFQRVMDEIITSKELHGTYAYLAYWTIQLLCQMGIFLFKAGSTSSQCFHTPWP